MTNSSSNNTEQVNLDQRFKAVDEHQGFIESPNNLPERSSKEEHRFPIFLKLAWTILIVWGLFYIVNLSLPDLKLWLSK